ncbi:SRPBCC domain-containing protein [Emcibacter sp.]|uniref:SRPBCC family protein n=1 Tax=Emcibacter sp. TaxID=1979954 RepID=UPI002AA78B0E|nr:SRPBCC domain-containing protein [Emcibacter sp.]
MISLKLPIKADPATVWSCLTDKTHLDKWWGDNVSLEAKVGGAFEERWLGREGEQCVTRGTVKTLEKNSKLHLSWADEDWEIDTEVIITLEPTESGTELTLSHTGWEGLMGDLMDSIREDHEAGWQSHLYSLKSYAERLNAG